MLDVLRDLEVTNSLIKQEDATISVIDNYYE